MIEVLGDIQLSLDGKAHTIGSRNQRLVLAALAAHPNRVVSADALIDALWEEEPPPTARRTLGSYVSRLRSVLGDLVEIAHLGYRLHADVGTLDLLYFEALVDQARVAGPARSVELLERALALVRGPAFGEFADLDQLRAAATWVDTLVIDAHERRAAALLGSGRPAEAAAVARAVVADHPLRETAWAVLIDAEAQSSPGEALRSYRRAVAELAEVGLVPSEALRNAETRALVGDEASARPRAVSDPSAPSGHLVGRDDALIDVGVLLQSHRLVTLIGAGGVGKTSLAREIARRHQGEYRLGARFIELGEVVEPEAVAAAIAEEIGLGSMDAVPEDRLADVGNLDVLIIIDNCEHLIDASATAVQSVLAGGSVARVLATSRQRLGISDERVWVTQPLDGDGGGGRANSVELFERRASSLGIDVSSDTAAVERIVERLDGLPLAIEMAAALLTSHGLGDLDDVTQADPTTLRAPRRGTPNRQRTLGNVVDWSLDTIDESARNAALALSVFDGAFDLDGATAVIEGGDQGSIVHDLVERSLLQADTADGRARYRMLWAVRSRLQRRSRIEQVDSARRRHARHHLDRLVVDDLGLRSASESAANARISDSYGDLRSAHLWASEHDEQIAASITTHLHVWAMSRQVGDPFRWAERLVADPTTAPPAALASQGQSWFYAGRSAEAIALVESALPRADPVAGLLLLETLGDIMLASGNLDRAVELGGELARAAEAVDDPHFVVMGACAGALAHGYSERPDEGLALVTELHADAPTDRAWIDYTVAELTAAREPDVAAHLFGRAVEAADSVDNRFLSGVARVSLSSVRADHGEPTGSVNDLIDAINHWRQRGMHAYLMTSLRNLIVLLDRLEQPELIAPLTGAVDAGSRVPTFGVEEQRLAAVAEHARQALGNAAYATLYNQAAATDLDNVLDDIIHRILDQVG